MEDKADSESFSEIDDLRDHCAKLELMVASLRKSEAQYRHLVDVSPIAIGIEHNRVIAYVNRAFVDLMHAKSPEELIGRPVADFLPESHESTMAAKIKRAAETGENRLQIEVKLIALDGSQLDVGISAAPVIFEGRQSMMVMFRDLTHLRRAEREKEKLTLQMLYVQKLESLGVLASGIAHDFNNLLMAVLGNLELALADSPRISYANANLLAAKEALMKAADLSRQLLAYSGRGQLLMEPVSLNQIIEKMARILEVSLPEKTGLIFRLAKELPPVKGDAAQMDQIVMNLVLNAAEAIGESGGQITVGTHIEQCSREYLARTWLNDDLPAGTYLALEVEDTGCGMDADTMARMFDPFFTTKFSGRGLGLAATLGIVRSHRGAIDVQSEPGRGTRFRILFPSLGDMVKAELQPAPASAEWRGSGSVLFADDESILRSMGAHMLKRLGFEALVAADGIEAVDIVRDFVSQGRDATLACAILDLKMPRMDGEEALREIRRLCPGLPVLLVSGFPEDKLIENREPSRPTGFMRKPYDLKALVGFLKAHARPVPKTI